MILKLLENAPRRPGITCTMGFLLATLETQEAAELDQALRGDYRSSDIARALEELGYKIGQSSISRHRRGECACRKP